MALTTDHVVLSLLPNAWPTGQNITGSSLFGVGKSGLCGQPEVEFSGD
jgi:hypothetical protein